MARVSKCSPFQSQRQTQPQSNKESEKKEEEEEEENPNGAAYRLRLGEGVTTNPSSNPGVSNQGPLGINSGGACFRPRWYLPGISPVKDRDTLSKKEEEEERNAESEIDDVEEGTLTSSDEKKKGKRPMKVKKRKQKYGSINELTYGPGGKPKGIAIRGRAAANESDGEKPPAAKRKRPSRIDVKSSYSLRSLKIYSEEKEPKGKEKEQETQDTDRKGKGIAEASDNESDSSDSD